MTGKHTLHSGTKEPGRSGREMAHSRLARELAAEGMVLLKNDGLLPLECTAPVALLGSGAAQTVKGGIGSGDVNNREHISIYRGFLEAGIMVTSKGWLEDYQERYRKARHQWKEKVLEDAKKVENPFDAYAENPFALPDGRRVTEADLTGACAAVYVISRISGEGKDRRKSKGDYYLSDREKEDLMFLSQMQLPTVLVLNVGAPVELTDILKEAGQIRAVLHISLPGQEGGYAVADVLFGKAVPGGRLTATWAKRYEDYPSADSYGYLNGNVKTEEYQEGIFVGYRYFDTFGIQPLYPFGFGLSYSTFSIVCKGVRVSGTRFTAEVQVKNTGEAYSGKEVAQVYVTLPQTGIAKEYQRLAGFAKTDMLSPGQSQRLTIEAGQKQLASFNEELHAWVVEAGRYGIWVGKHSASLELAAVLEVLETVILEQTEAVCRKTADFQDLKPDSAVRTKAEEWMEAARTARVPVILLEPKPINTAAGIERQAEPLAAELPVETLIPLLYGNITQGASTLGSAGTRVPGSAGETTQMLEAEYGIRSLIMADGPAGIRLRQSYEVDRETDTVYGAGVLGSLENGFLEPDAHHEDADRYYQYCTAFPVGTALAQTWDTARMKAFGRAVAVEMEEFHVDLWLAPGMNIHRNPLCGRNFEYYSEDPFLSGRMAAAVTQGVQESGKCGVTLKHFACNNQEDNRMGVDACISERALREIYLRGFEMAVSTCAPAAIMTSYNCVNGTHAANSKDLCTTVARKEWGFDGVIMSDWNTTVPQGGSVPWQCAAAGNDVIMPGNQQDAENIQDAYARGELSEQAIRDCARRVLALVLRLR
ncbi:MAG: glycoside hydrolase family 3 C-terminal domain-containing protein [Eubacterium sp.]|nr:glycoside hydrolase family 3 C-terminal domain-containing protein [Eubacterium sp.]